MVWKKYDIDSARKIFEDAGCILLEEEYYHVKYLMKYQCSCGNISKMALDTFKRGVRCKKCGIKKSSKQFRNKLEDVQETFIAGGCVLLSNKYKNARTPLDYVCECGNESKITYDNFRRGVRCKQCGLDKLSELHRHSYAYVFKKFEEAGCKLLSSDYKNSKQVLDYVCTCGRESKTMYINFMKGKRCKECAIENHRGENHPNYNPNLTEEERGRRVFGHRKWRRGILERDGNKCLRCNSPENLNVHHILNYATNKELVVDDDNGATLCRDCHVGFHKKFGSENNNKDQLNEWVGDLYA